MPRGQNQNTGYLGFCSSLGCEDYLFRDSLKAELQTASLFEIFVGTYTATASVFHQNLAESLEAFARGELTRSKSTGEHRNESVVGRFLIGRTLRLDADL